MENIFKKFYCWNKKILSKKWKILLFNLKIWFKNIQDFICQQEAHGLKVPSHQIRLSDLKMRYGLIGLDEYKDRGWLTEFLKMIRFDRPWCIHGSGWLTEF